MRFDLLNYIISYKTRIKLMIGLVYFGSLGLAAQSTKTSEIDSLISSAEKFTSEDKHEKLNLLFEAINLSKAIDYNKGIAEASKIAGIIYFENSIYDSSYNYHKISLKYFSFLQDTASMAGESAQLGNVLSRFGDIDSSIAYHRRAYILYAEFDKSLAATQISTIGLRYLWSGQYANAEIQFSKALELRYEVNDSSAIASTYNNFGVLYWRWGKLKSSLNMYEKAIDLRAKLNNIREMIYPRLNIGLILIDLMDYNYAEKYLLEGLKLAEDIEYPNGVAIAYLYLTELYLRMGDSEKTTQYGRNAIIKCEEVNSPLAKIKASNLLAKGLVTQKQFPEAQRILLEALKDLESYKSSQIVSDIYYSLASLEYDRDNLTKARSYIESALSGPEPTANVKKEIALLAAKIYQGLGLNRSSVQQYNNYYLFADSLYNKQVVEVVSNWRTKYETTLQENEILRLKELSLLQDAEIIQQVNIRNILAISSIFVLIIALLLWRLFRQKQKLIVEIENQKEALSNANEAKLKLFSIIAHDLRNPFMTLLGLTTELQKNEDEMEEEDIKTSVEVIHSSAKKLSRLSQNLLDWARINTNGIDAYPENNDVSLIVNEIAGEFNEQAKKKNIDIKVETIDGLICYCDKNMISTIIRNLINNAIKFSYSGGIVNVSALNNSGIIEIKVQDAGVGISNESKEEIFSSSKFYSTNGTNSEKGSGLGLKISQEFAKLNNAQLLLIKNSRKQTTFLLSLPAS